MVQPTRWDPCEEVIAGGASTRTVQNVEMTSGRCTVLTDIIRIGITCTGGYFEDMQLYIECVRPAIYGRFLAQCFSILNAFPRSL